MREDPSFSFRVLSVAPADHDVQVAAEAIADAGGVVRSLEAPELDDSVVPDVDVVLLPRGWDSDVRPLREAAPRTVFVECGPGPEDGDLRRGLDGRLDVEQPTEPLVSQLRGLLRRRREVAMWRETASRPHALLIADPDSALFSQLEGVLSEHGWVVHRAPEPGAALRRVREDEIHVFVVDGADPERIALARALLRYAPELASQLVAPDPALTDALASLRSDGVGYRLSPTDPDGLPAIIERSWVLWMGTRPGQHWADARPPDRSLRVLLVEDAEAAPSLRDLLDTAPSATFGVERVDTLAAAGRALSEGAVDLVLLDSELPDGEGIEAFLRLHHRAPTTPFVVVTASDEAEFARLVVDCGAQDLLTRSGLTAAELERRLRFAAERAHLLGTASRLARDLQERDRQLRKANLALREANARLDELASVDVLTDLLNRRGLDRVLAEEAKQARREGTALAAVLVDCDDFKAINDRLGHAVGDLILQQMAGRLRASLRPTDRAARVGGDEFLVLLPATRITEALHVAERLRLAVGDSPVQVGPERVRITASLGVAEIDVDFVSIEEVLTLTRLALKRSKGGGKNRVSVQGGSRPRASAANLAQLRDPASYRPVAMPIHRLSDGTDIGWEMLARCAVGPLRRPLDFFRLALEENCLTAVDLACLRASLAAADRLPRGALVALNMFPSTLLATPIESLLSMLGSDRSWCLEVSDRQFIGDPTSLRERTRELQRAGVRIAVDDVGFGRTSLETLLVLEPDIIKIDRRFIDGIGLRPDLRRRLDRLVQAVAPLDAMVVAEGVEREDDLEALQLAGVDYAEGLVFGEPIEP